MPMAPLDQRGAACAVSTAHELARIPILRCCLAREPWHKNRAESGTTARGYSGRLRGKPAPERAAKGDPGRCEAASRLALVTYKCPSP